MPSFKLWKQQQDLFCFSHRLSSFMQSVLASIGGVGKPVPAWFSGSWGAACGMLADFKYTPMLDPRMFFLSFEISLLCFQLMGS